MTTPMRRNQVRFRQIFVKKLQEMCDNKSDIMLNTAELLPNIYDNHQDCHFPNISGYSINIWLFHKYLAGPI